MTDKSQLKHPYYYIYLQIIFINNILISLQRVFKCVRIHLQCYFTEEFMSKIKLTTVAFKGTAEQETQLRQMLKEIMSSEHPSVMTALQKAQSIYGYLPVEVQSIIADTMGVSLEEVFGVATFYSQFTLNPQGAYAFGVCLGTACYVKGSGDNVAQL